MSTNLKCNKCGEDLGKDTENSKLAYCPNCGKTDVPNPRGHND